MSTGLAYARSSAFYDTTLFWRWMRLPGDAVFAFGALLMAWDFIVKLRPPRIPSNSANSLPSANGRLGA
jgi:nitric oxide reductase large subunit